MAETLSEIARKISNAPWNQPGSDKTWVLDAMAQALKFQREVRKLGRA
jgi:hypothetical protein